MEKQLPTLAEAKQEAKRLRGALAEEGRAVRHSEVLELVARRYGFRDWNGFHARIAEHGPVAWVPGGRVRGRYLSQPFAATVLSVQMLREGWFRLSLDLDEAVDVVTFDSFSSHRKRANCVVGPNGTTREKTSDGEPHVVLEMGGPGA